MTDVLDDARTIAAAAEAEQRRVGEEPMTADTEGKLPTRRSRSGWTALLSALVMLAVLFLSLAVMAGGAWRLFQLVGGV